MLDEDAKRLIRAVQRDSEAMIDALKLTVIEKEYAMEKAKQIVDEMTAAYFNDEELDGRKIRPIAVAAAVAFGLTYFDKWVGEMERKFPGLGQ